MHKIIFIKCSVLFLCITFTIHANCSKSCLCPEYGFFYAEEVQSDIQQNNVILTPKIGVQTANFSVIGSGSGVIVFKSGRYLITYYVQGDPDVDPIISSVGLFINNNLMPSSVSFCPFNFSNLFVGEVITYLSPGSIVDLRNVIDSSLTTYSQTEDIVSPSIPVSLTIIKLK